MVAMTTVHGAVSAFSLYLMMATVVPMGLLLAPQPVRKDKRVIVGLLLVAAAVIGVPLLAFDSAICTYAWWAIECWFR